jgi:AcrR family transcriptional regulator
VATKKRKKRSGERLSREKILAAAVKLADEVGLDALSMRKLATSLGVEAMSLYHHVANKDALLDGMVDSVFEEIPLPDPDKPWREAMRLRALEVRAAFNRHPWAVHVVESRQTPGMATLRHHDAVLGCLRTAGFSLPLTASAYSLMDSYIFGFAIQELQMPFDPDETPTEVTQAIIQQMEASRGVFPHMVEMAVEHVMQPGYTYGKEFERGLSLILDGLEKLREAEAQS